jgi:hypothetical protein
VKGSGFGLCCAYPVKSAKSADSFAASSSTLNLKSMKYILLVHHNEDVLAGLSEGERQSMLAESVQLANTLHSSGQYFDAAPLHSSSDAARVAVRDGNRIVTDGPFAETREQVGGYFLIDAGSLEEAVDIAGRIPGARIGTVEVRPVKEVSGLPKL